jgi:KDO2-lipid IV(A) lauroyltransferase
MLIHLFRFLSLFPLPLLHFIGVIMGRIVYYSSKKYRLRLQENLTQADFIQYKEQAINEAGKSIMELPFIWCASNERILNKVTFENWEVAQAALDSKKGVIFLTPHLGCFELSGKTIALRAKMTCLYRPPKKAILKPLLEGARAESGMTLAPANLSGVRTLAKALKRGEAIGLLPDQVPQQGEGVWADFFHKPAYTMTLSAKLHQMTGSPIILIYAERLPNGAGFIQRFIPFSEALEGDANQQARSINIAMEKLISLVPAQYFWSYHRYKTPDGVEGPNLMSEVHPLNPSDSSSKDDE